MSSAPIGTVKSGSRDAEIQAIVQQLNAILAAIAARLQAAGI